MAVTYTWTIPTVERTISTGGINIIHWRCRAVDGDFAAVENDTVHCTPNPSESDFISYENVTLQNCISWAQDAVGKDAVEDSLSAKIDLQRSPPQASGVPW